VNQRGPSGNEPAKDPAVLQELAAGVVHGVYRTVKACQFHADVSNDAVTSLTASAATAIAEYCAHAGTETVALSFLGDAIFVNRQILKASRDTHALAGELRDLLGSCEVTELTLMRSVDRAAISSFAKLLADVQRDRSLAARLTAGEIPGISAGKAKFAASGGAREESPGQRAARTYATSVLTVQAVLADVRQGKFELPRRIKRVAQQVVARADEDSRLLVALAATGGVSLDAATIAVGSAILSVAMARQLTTDRVVLANAAMAALLYDVGRVVLGGSGEGPQRNLNDDELDRVPTRTVMALTALGRMHAPARARTALLYEVWSMRRAHRLGPVYLGRRPPTLLARIIGVARAFAELRGAGAGGGLSIDDALQMLGNRAADGTERALVKLLIGALGIYPAGTMVTLNTGELGVVMGTPAMPLDYVRPPVKILYDEHANLLEQPIDLDLAAPQPGQPPRFIWKTVDADDQQMKAMRAFVVAATAAKRRGALEEEEAQAAPPRSSPHSSRSLHEPAQPAPQNQPTEPRPPALEEKRVAESTLQSAVGFVDDLARRITRPPTVTQAEPVVTVRPPVASPPNAVAATVRPPGTGESTPRSTHHVAPFAPASVPPPPRAARHVAPFAPASIAPPPRSEPKPPPRSEPQPAPRSEPQPAPRSEPQPAPRSEPQPEAARRRDPRNDSAPPSSMMDEIHRPVRAARPPRVPPIAANPDLPPPSARVASPPAPPVPARPGPATKDNETVRPPPSSASRPTIDEDSPSSHTESTRQMTWESYEQLLNPGKPTAPALAAVQPKSSPMPDQEEEGEEPASSRDELLAAFLADAPLDSGESDPPPKKKAEKVTVKRDK
jgi:hypothetical protein